MADTIFGTMIFGGLFLFFTGVNYWYVYHAWIKPEKTPSPAPFLGGIFGAITMLGLFGLKNPFLIVLPFLIDVGSIPFLVHFIVVVVKEEFGSRKK